MLSTKLARRARPPLGVCHPQGLVLPLTSVVDRMTSLSGSLKESPSATATADASTTRTSSERAIRARDERDRSDTLVSVGTNARLGSSIRSDPSARILRAARETRQGPRTARPASGPRILQGLGYSWTRYREIGSEDGMRRPDPGWTTRTSNP